MVARTGLYDQIYQVICKHCPCCISTLC